MPLHDRIALAIAAVLCLAVPGRSGAQLPYPPRPGSVVRLVLRTGGDLVDGRVERAGADSLSVRASLGDSTLRIGLADIERMYVRTVVESRRRAVVGGAARGLAVGSAVGAGFVGAGLALDLYACRDAGDDGCIPVGTGLGAIVAVIAVVGGTIHGTASGISRPLREEWKRVNLPVRVGLAPARGGLGVRVGFDF